MKNTIALLARGRGVAIAFAVMIVVFTTTHVASFPGTVSHFREVTNGQVILDLRASSSADETWQRLDAMGEAGRDAYLKLIGVVDVVFPLSVTAALLALALFVAERMTLRRSLTVALASLPLIYLLLDLAENVLVLRMLLAFPERLAIEGELVGWLTRAKRGTEIAALLLPLAALLLSSVASRITALRRRDPTRSDDAALVDATKNARVRP
jgi:hypothetical protein